MEPLNSFLLSDIGLYFGYALLALGVADIFIIWQILWKKYKQTGNEKLRRLIGLVIPMVLIWFALGGYTMWLRYGAN